MTLSILESRGHWGIKKGLDNIRALLNGLDNPENAYPSLLIAGTNGKGSAGAFLAHALKNAGLRVGWTTSPHLVSPVERVWIDGKHICEKELEHNLSQVLEVEANSGIFATYFELIVASALLAFKQASIDLAIVEVGMGGRWDSTNILDPILTILTNVGLDHMTHLGSTLEVIAAEKLCTARDNRPLVLGPTLDPDWLMPLCESKPKMFVAQLPHAEVFWDHSIVNGHRINIAGEHQLYNLATAIKTVEALRNLGWQLDEDKIYSGLSMAEWPGRLWSVPGLTNVVFDGAHNADGAKALANHIKKSGVRPYIYFCACSDKALSDMAAALTYSKPASVFLVSCEGPRFATLDEMQAAWTATGCSDLPVLTTTELATKLVYNKDETCVVTGSLYFLGMMMKELNISV